MFNFIKNEGAAEILEAISSSSPSFSLSSHTTFNQTQTGAIVPLKVLEILLEILNSIGTFVGNAFRAVETFLENSKSGDHFVEGVGIIHTN